MKGAGVERLPPFFMIKTILIFLLLTSVASADVLKIPFSCWPKELQEEFSKIGKKLDLSGAERTEESWGYVVNEGTQFSIYTYNSATPEDFEVIQNIVWKIEKRHE